MKDLGERIESMGRDMGIHETNLQRFRYKLEDFAREIRNEATEAQDQNSYLLGQNVRLRTCYDAAVCELRAVSEKGVRIDWNAVLLPNLEIAERIYDLADSYAAGWEARGKADAPESDSSALAAGVREEKGNG